MKQGKKRLHSFFASRVIVILFFNPKKNFSPLFSLVSVRELYLCVDNQNKKKKKLLLRRRKKKKVVVGWKKLEKGGIELYDFACVYNIHLFLIRTSLFSFFPLFLMSRKSFFPLLFFCSSERRAVSPTDYLFAFYIESTTLYHCILPRCTLSHFAQHQNSLLQIITSPPLLCVCVLNVGVWFSLFFSIFK